MSNRRNEVIHLLLTPHFFIWFVEYNGLIHHHLIPHKLIISVIPHKLIISMYTRSELME
jgi:hypothetical protein